MPSPKSIIQKKMRACEDLAARCANEQPSVTNQPALSIRPLSRRRFIGRIGGASAAAWTSSAISLSPVLGSKSVKAEAATILGRHRAIEADSVRRDAALADYHLPIVSHPNNGDEDLYSNKIGNYSKGLPHNNVGEVDLAAYNSYLAAIRSGLPSDFESIILGGNTKLTDPQCGLAFAMEGMDAGNSFEPPCPAVASQERADEAVENYWMALLCDERDGPAGLRRADLAFRLSRTQNQWPGHAADFVPWFHNRGYRRTIYLAVPATTRIPWGAPNGAALYHLRNRARLYDGRQLLAGGAERAGSVWVERPQRPIAVPARRAGCRRFRPRGSFVPGVFHGTALAAQKREL